MKLGLWLAAGELRAHPWRLAATLAAIAVGVALGLAVHLINASAVTEFSQAVRATTGQADLEIRGPRAGFDDAVLERVAADADIALASPILDVDAPVLDAPGLAKVSHGGTPGPAPTLRIVGIDVFRAGGVTPGLIGAPADEARLALLADDTVFLSAAAQSWLGLAPGDTLTVQAGLAAVALRVAGGMPGARGGQRLASMDLGAAQWRLARLGRLSRIALRLAPGADRNAVKARLGALMPAGVFVAEPEEGDIRASNLSRAYRVNLDVLALVALFTGAFLVFSILSLSVARRAPQLALLGVLGLSARGRLAWMLAESALIGLAGSVLGLALGTGLAALALRLLAGDLGGAYFPGVAPRLQFSTTAALVYGALGVAVAVAGGWLPARSAQRIAPAQALKGLGESHPQHSPAWLGPLLLALGVLLAQAPPVAGIPLAAYASVACLLLGGIACVPAAVALLLRRTRAPRHALVLLAVQRARHERSSATIAVSGVVASLALAVALTVMVTSFREAVTQWLDDVLPADLYARAAAGGGNDTAWVDDALVAQLRALPGVARVEGQRVAAIQLDASRPTVALVAKRVADDPARRLPLLGELLPAREGLLSVYVSEPAASLYGLRAGARFELPLPDGQRERAFVRAVWRDYARQHGAALIEHRDYVALTGDDRVNDAALLLEPGATPSAVAQALRERFGAEHITIALPGEIRALSLQIFDRTFLITYLMEAVAVVIGLFGIATTFAALAATRQGEFGMLRHLGFTRAEIGRLIATEGALTAGLGVIAGLAGGAAIAWVLIEIINRQSFHWSMELAVPWSGLAIFAVCLVLLAALVARLAGRHAMRRSAVLAVKADW